MKKHKQNKIRAPKPKITLGRRTLRNPLFDHNLFLDAFSEADVKEWAALSEERVQFEYNLHYCLESQRAAVYDKILETLKSQATINLELKDWWRNHACKYETLSAYGSILQVGGRFNIGQGVDQTHFPYFHALYLAEDIESAHRERFGISAVATANAFDRFDFGLLPSSSYTVAKVNLQVKQIFDLTNVTNLQKLMTILREFQIPQEIMKQAKSLGMPTVNVIRTALQMHGSLLDPNWRLRPQQLSIPANSQIFGKMLLDAGFEGILFPSTTSNARCLTVFPTNLKNSDSYLEVIEGPKNDVVRLDKDNYLQMITDPTKLKAPIESKLPN